MPTRIRLCRLEARCLDGLLNGSRNMRSLDLRRMSGYRDLGRAHHRGYDRDQHYPQHQPGRRSPSSPEATRTLLV